MVAKGISDLTIMSDPTVIFHAQSIDMEQTLTAFEKYGEADPPCAVSGGHGSDPAMGLPDPAVWRKRCTTRRRRALPIAVATSIFRANIAGSPASYP